MELSIGRAKGLAMTISLVAFRPVDVVSADDQFRMAVSRVGVAKGTRDVVAVNDDGDVLRPLLAPIPRRELIAWENELLRDSLAWGLAQSAAGDTVYLGSFAACAEDDEPEE